MVQLIHLIRLANHWYVALEHHDANDVALDPKAERLLERIDYMGTGKLSVYIYQNQSVLSNTGIVQFDADSLDRYLTTDDSFIMTMYVDDHEFNISSELYTLLIEQLGIMFHENYCKIEIW